MKIILLISIILLLSSCSVEHRTNSNPNYYDFYIQDVCVNHKKDYEFFKSEFKKEHDKICKNGCSYTESMIKNSDTMHRIAGTYYLMNCDSSNGRLN